MRHWIASSLLLLAMTMPALAEESAAVEEKKETAKKEEPFTYSPEYCEFTVTFPGEPYQTERCDGEGDKKCYKQTSYTQVFDLTSTVNFRVICNEIGEDVRKTYSGEIMEATLKAMTEKTVVKTFETSFREEEGYKQAGLVGEGKVGRLPTIYIAQLWIGDQSAFSVEAELIGSESHDADKLFSEVLKSVSYKGDATAEEEKPADEKAEEEKPAEEEKSDKEKEEE